MESLGFTKEQKEKVGGIYDWGNQQKGHTEKRLYRWPDDYFFIDKGETTHDGDLTVTSEPPGAEVLVNSYVPLGDTPFAEDKMPTGTYRVTVRKDGYYEQVRMVDVAKGETSRAHFDMKPIPYAHLTVEAIPQDAKLSIIGLHEGYSTGMKLAPGDYLLTVNHSKHGKHRLHVVLRSNEALTIKANLTATSGTIKVAAKQPGTTVYLDGREAGRAPLTISGLLPGPHKTPGVEEPVQTHN